MTVSGLHYVDVVDGEFRGTTPGDLEEIFQTVETSKQREHLVVHFHGGLVPRRAAEGVAETLFSDYIAVGGYPVFFYWHSGALEVLANNLGEVGREPVFQRLVRRLAQFLAGKLVETAATRGLQIQIESLKDIPTESEPLLDWTRQRVSAAVHDVEELTPSQRNQIERELQQDPVLVEESRAVAAGLLTPEEIEYAIASRARGGLSVRASRKTLMSPAILKRISGESPDPGSRGLATALAIAKYGVAIAAAVVGRYRQQRDHGLLTTIVEEVARTLYADSIGATVWTLIKADTQRAFGGDPQRHGGTAFVAHLRQWSRPGRRITLVGHSTGAIYIGHLLEHADKVLAADRKFEVVFLAPA
jgi:hypothetical protein